MLVNCKAAPKNIEKIKKLAIFGFLNKTKAFNPSFSRIPFASFLLFSGGQLGNVKAYKPKIIAPADAI